MIARRCKMSVEPEDEWKGFARTSAAGIKPKEQETERKKEGRKEGGKEGRKTNKRTLNRGRKERQGKGHRNGKTNGHHEEDETNSGSKEAFLEVLLYIFRTADGNAEASIPIPGRRVVCS